jgi:tetratricopeptide (TPR) repeat protein
MNDETRQLIESYKSEGDNCLKNQEWGPARIAYEKALEEFDRIQSEEEFELVTADDKALRAQIEEALGQATFQLAQQHREWGLAALKSKDYARAVEEFEEAIDLAGEDNLAFLEEVKQLLDKARVKNRDHELYEELTPFVERGDGFRRAGNYAEAILEYQEALKAIAGLPPTHRFVSYLRDALRECRRQLIKPYLVRIHRAIHAGKPAHAHNLLKRAMLLLDETDLVYRAFLAQIRDSIPVPAPTEVEEGEEVESPETWAKAIRDYEEALDLYTSFTLSDPLSPAYTGVNIYEDRFLSARRNLANLYKSRGDRFRDQLKLEKAIRSYKEALKLYPRSDRLFHETFREMKKLRAQLNQPSLSATGK